MRLSHEIKAHEVRAHAVKAEAKAQGMREMSEKFRSVGGELYVPTTQTS
jgi:signal transduction histidine kinase